MIPAEKRQKRMSEIHASEEKQGLLSTSDEQQRKRELVFLSGNGPIPILVDIFIEEGDEGLLRRLKAWSAEKERILRIKTAKRSKKERNRAQWLQKQIRNMKKDWPNIKTPAEKDGHNET